MYFPMMSTSILTSSPGFRWERLVTSQVLGMMAISKWSSVRPADGQTNPFDSHGAFENQVAPDLFRIGDFDGP